jgi:SAM-dependent methyltransferase
LTWEEAIRWLRSQPDQAQLIKDCFYDDPLAAAAERYYKGTEWQAVRKLLPGPPGRALDLGAGRGISSYALAKEGWNVVALEPDRSGIVGSGAVRRLAEETGLGMAVVEEWGERLSFGEETFNLVYCRAVLHHAGDLAQLCGEIGRVLKKGGTFIATREHVISAKKDLNTFLDSHPLHRLYGGENAYLLDEYLSAIRKGGMMVTRTLNPFESDINLFPDTVPRLKKKLADAAHLPWPGLIPDGLLRILGGISNMPGRLYSFMGVKNP